MPASVKSRISGRRNARTAFVVAVAATLVIGFSACSGGDGINDQPLGAGTPPAEATEAPPVKVDSAGPVFDAEKVYRETVAGVISVRAIFDTGAAGGSGFVLSDDGEIVTNAHVITDGQGDDRAAANQVFVEFFDGNVLPAEIIGFDPFSDVGLIKVDPDEVDLTPLKLTDSESVQVGEPIAVIGSPFGEEYSLSTGVVSQTGRSVMSLTDFQIDGAIQTDASINPGNSGGPMLNESGEVIGISQQMKSGSGSSDGVGFGVPSNSIQNSLGPLRENGVPSYAYIGVSTQPVYPQLADKLGFDVENGALVAEVVKGGPAEKAGIKGGNEQITFQADIFEIGGDLIVSANGQEIERAEDLGVIIGSLRSGDTVELGIIRDGKEMTVDIDLEERPTALSRPDLQP